VVGSVKCDADEEKRDGKHDDANNDVHLELSDLVYTALDLAMEQKDTEA